MQRATPLPGWQEFLRQTEGSLLLPLSPPLSTPSLTHSFSLLNPEAPNTLFLPNLPSSYTIHHRPCLPQPLPLSPSVLLSLTLTGKDSGYNVAQTLAILPTLQHGMYFIHKNLAYFFFFFFLFLQKDPD